MLPLDESNVIGQPTPILRQDIIVTILLLIREGWEQVCQADDITVASDEDTIAGALHNEMWFAKERLGIIGPPQIVNEPASRKSRRSLKPDGFIDFKMFYGWGTQEDYFGIECKRISSTGKDRDLATKYIKNGVMRFITGIYSPGHDFAAMVSFVIDKKLPNCVSLVQERVRKYRQEICLEGDWSTDHNFGIQDNLYQTIHRQYGQSMLLRLLHLFLVIE